MAGDQEPEQQHLDYDKSSTIPRNSDISQSYRLMFQSKRPASTAGLPSTQAPYPGQGAYPAGPYPSTPIHTGAYPPTPTGTDCTVQCKSFYFYLLDVVCLLGIMLVYISNSLLKHTYKCYVTSSEE